MMTATPIISRYSAEIHSPPPDPDLWLEYEILASLFGLRDWRPINPCVLKKVMEELSEYQTLGVPGSAVLGSAVVPGSEMSE